MTMLSGDGVISGGWLYGPVDRREAADQGVPIVPKFVVMHYTASSSAEGSADWLTRRDEVYVSAHVVIGRDGDVTQLVPFDRKAYHCGVSAWMGYEGLNAYAVGVELVNWGLLSEDSEGRLFSPTGKLVHEAQGVYRPHKSEPGRGRWWQSYTTAQLESAARVVRAVMSAYGIGLADVIGHDDIAPGRKVDPGPAFDWGKFRVLLAGEGQGQVLATDGHR